MNEYLKRHARAFTLEECKTQIKKAKSEIKKWQKNQKEWEDLYGHIKKLDNIKK